MKIILLIIVFASCAPKPIKGVVTDVNGQVVTIGNDSFKVYKQLPNIGDTVSFKPTVNRKKINSKKL